MTSKRPFFVIAPGASQNPAHYGCLSHLLHLAGYPVLTALLPSLGATNNVSVEDDAEYIRNRMILPIIDYEERDVILVMHSYSSAPGSAAVSGLGKVERVAQGKTAGVIGQIFITAVLPKGDDGKSIVDLFGGNLPPHIRADVQANLLCVDDRIPPLYQNVLQVVADAAAASMVAHGMTSFTSPIPRASWDRDEYKGRIAFVRAIHDAAIPLAVQQMMLDGSGVDWIIKDIESDHCPNLSQPEKLTELLVDLAKVFETLETRCIQE